MHIKNLFLSINYLTKTESKQPKIQKDAELFECQNNKSIYRNFIVNPFLIHKAKIITLKDKKGKEINAILIHNKKNKNMYIIQGNDTLGSAIYSISKAPIKGNNYPDYYKNRNYLFINSINSNQKYKGVGTELIKKLVKESKKQGCEGRICLNATTTKPQKGSPIPFYYKLGFEASNKQKHEEIQKALEKDGKIPSSCESVTLYLPEISIKKLDE